MVVHYTDRSGRERIKGGRDLKASQAYPQATLGCKVSMGPKHVGFNHYRSNTPRFGVAMGRLRSKYAKQQRRKAAKFLLAALEGSSELNAASSADQFWSKHAGLKSIFAFLAKQA